MTSVRLPELSERTPPKDVLSTWDVLRRYFQKLIGATEHEMEVIYDNFNSEINPLTISLVETAVSYQSGKRSAILVDTSAGAVTITLPEPEDSYRSIYVIKKTTTDANTLTVSTLAGALIDGSASYTTSATNYPVLRVLSDGERYWII